ncbi:iron-containing alcohol dehydrogenase [Tistrella mobilis]|uniref:iron-containing alcohol dehydrogenase n=1 Tax=Tistrella mobilis TaxID=171437 RepID=UPI003557BB1F
MKQGVIACAPMEQVVYGTPAAEAVAAEAARIGANRVFLLHSGTLDRETDEIARIRAGLGDRLVGSSADMPPHSPRARVIALGQTLRESGADLLVTVGGGSITDGGKVARLAAKMGWTDPAEMEPHHMYPSEDGGIVVPPVPDPDIPQIAVPTSLSGGEFYPLGGSTDEVTGLKQGYLSRGMGPRVVVLDPAITRHTPEWLWLSTGVRALDHAMETLGSLLSNDYCDGIAACALELLAEGLPRVKADPEDLEARLKCQIGVWQSMIPIVAGVPMGASHAIGHMLGGVAGVAHGHTSCVMAPAVLRFNAPVNAGRQVRIALSLGAAAGETAADAADRFIAALGMPRSLSAVGVTAADFDRIAEATMHDIWIRTNPRTVDGPAVVRGILESAA